MPFRRRLWFIAGLAGIGGFVSYLAFKPQGLWFLAPLALGVLFIALDKAGRGTALAGGLAFGLAQFLPMLTWAYNAAGMLPYLALAILTAALLAIGPLAYAWTRPLWGGKHRCGPALDAVCFALLFTGADTLRSFVPFGGFPWGRLGFSQATGPLARWAWVGGAPVVGLVVALIVPFAIGALRSWRNSAWGPAAAGAACAAGLIAAPWLFPIEATAESGTLRVGAVQGDVDVTAEGLFAQQRQVLENHVAQTLVLVEAAGADAFDVVLWPENSTDIDPRTDDEAADAIETAAAAIGVPLLVGAMEYIPEGGRYNQGLLWVAGEGVVAEYAKQHPAPFAEYMPARSFFRLFTSKVDLIGTDMAAGNTVGVFEIPTASLERTVMLGDVICFEVAYDSIVAETVRAGAEAIAVQTNNASFGFSEEAWQQLAMTRLRAIELGRSTVQISTVGISAAFAPDGSFLAGPTELFEPAWFAVELPLRTSLTPAASYGSSITLVLMAAAAMLALTGIAGRLIKRT
ncbi:MAG: apolipoprotein N-acyltransferase [Bifidobacteriaceae bacterium]|jgi:apolipoprotein N-acyltransferase|nr:apolipoprotein N-acyltransferase [Bifidobacteriaceae bacterium]